MMNANLIEVRNPYPEWQSLSGETNCWNCFKLLWHRADTLKHLCNDCQQTHIAVEVSPRIIYNDDDHPFDGVEPGLGRIE